MVKCTIECKSFLEVLQTLRDIGYEDGLFNFYEEDILTQEEDGYKDFVETILRYTSSNLPGFFNLSYPECIMMNITPYGVNYMLNGIGLGVRYYMNNKTGDITNYILTVSFNKPSGILKRNPIFANISNIERFAIEETEKVKKPYKKS